ncbi:hypothetical protein TNCV_4719931 [Trichonephila clavipes]|uniref:Uncharacterized protein n=1 Tax=Trichonephila clavipes TaxID=2585209 RepID=A0A8X7BEH9_TRICX|nr:hypothetical protein TNCV_4719931 [Trichonephila clavipes]
MCETVTAIQRFSKERKTRFRSYSSQQDDFVGVERGCVGMLRAQRNSSSYPHCIHSTIDCSRYWRKKDGIPIGTEEKAAEISWER